MTCSDIRITDKPKKGDVEVFYSGEENLPKHKQIDWEDEDEFTE